MNAETTKRNRIYVTADLDTYGRETGRIALNAEAAIEINDKRWFTGITMDRCWFGKNRIITQSYSIWDNGKGACSGTRYEVISDPSEILQFCRKAKIEPPSWINAQEG